MENVETSKWSDLPYDMLEEIAKHLYCYDDYYQFRGVCKQWNTVLPQIPNHPWLVLPFDDKAFEKRVAEKNIYYMKLPELQNSKLRGSCFGWLIAVGLDDTLRMLNPFTRKHYDLPPISTFPNIYEYDPDYENSYTVIDLKYFGNNSPDIEDVEVHHDDGEVDDGDSYDEGDDPNEDFSDESDDDSNEDSYDDFDFDSIRENILPGPVYGTIRVSNKFIQTYQVSKIIISSPPDDNHNQNDFIAISIYGNYSRLAFCKRGDNKWTDIPKSQKDDVDCHYDYDDVIFHEGKIYAIDIYTQIFEFDIENHDIPIGRIIEIPKPHDLYFYPINWKVAYLVGCQDGGLLMVIRHLKFYSVPNTKFKCQSSPKFDIYKLEKGTKEWSKVFDLKNYAILIGFNSSALMSTNIFSNGWENRVHYTDNLLHTQGFKVIGGNDIGVFNFEDGTSNQLFPDITLLSPPPLWLL